MFQLSAHQFSEVVAALRAVASSSGGNEKRRFTRMEVAARIAVVRLTEGKITRLYTALTKDVSAGGIGLMQCAPMEMGEEFIVRLPCGKQQLDVVTKATFSRSLAEGIFGTGGEFQRMASKELLAEVSRAADAELERIKQSVLK